MEYMNVDMLKIIWNFCNESKSFSKGLYGTKEGQEEIEKQETNTN